MLHRQLLWRKFVCHFQNLFMRSQSLWNDCYFLFNSNIIRTTLKTNFGFESKELSLFLRLKKSSPTGSWTRVSRVKAEYPDHLDYRGVHMLSTGIEPATLGLWDPRAANCATKALVSVVLSSQIKSDFFISRLNQTHAAYFSNENANYKIKKQLCCLHAVS